MRQGKFLGWGEPPPVTTFNRESHTWLRRARLSLFVGLTMTSVGVAVLLLSIYLIRGTIDWPRAAGSLAMLVIICGVVMGGVSLLALKGRSIEEAYSLGYDVAFEKGYRAGQQQLADACPSPTCPVWRIIEDDGGPRPNRD